jgi:small subunit ribosomal protein S16
MAYKPATVILSERSERRISLFFGGVSKREILRYAQDDGGGHTFANPLDAFQIAIGESHSFRYTCWIRLRRICTVLMIRLARIGKKKRPFYRIVVTEKTRPRNGRFVEIVGTYDPLKKPAAIDMKDERVQYWLSKGAQPSDTVRSFLRNRKPA